MQFLNWNILYVPLIQIYFNTDLILRDKNDKFVCGKVLYNFFNTYTLTGEFFKEKNNACYLFPGPYHTMVDLPRPAFCGRFIEACLLHTLYTCSNLLF